MPSPAYAAICDPLSRDTYGSRVLAPWAQSPPTSHLRSHANWLFGRQLQQQTVVFISMRYKKHGKRNSGSVYFLICSLVLDLGKTWQIWEALWTETDTLVHKAIPFVSPSSASLSYTSTAVFMKFTAVSVQLKRSSSFEPCSNNYKINLDLTDMPKHAPGQAWFLDPWIKC